MMSDKSWICVVYYTPNYSGEASKLKDSMDSLDLPYYMEVIENKGGWDKNTHYKPTFIRKCLDMFPEKDIVYVDADATFEHYPELFDVLECDIAYWVNTYPNKSRHQLATGTLFFANNDATRRICDGWIKECADEDYEILEQDKLKKALRFLDNILSFVLPVEYCAIFDHPTIKNVVPVIKHYQASRRLK